MGSTVYQELNPGDGIGISMVGSAMTLWYKAVGGAWSSLATVSDNTLTTAGYLYLDVYGDVARIDDFGGGTPPIGLAPAPAQLAWLARVSAAWQGLWGKAGSLARWAQGVQNLWQRVWAKGAYATLGATRLELLPRAAAVQSLTPPPAGQIWRNYIWVGNQRIAVHEYTASGDTVSYLLANHLGSTSVTTDATGALQSEIRYTAYGEIRYSSGATPTQFRYTGQLSQMDTVGLYYYGARWYDPYLNRFLSPDDIVPDPYNPLDWDRYSYTRNNPVNYTDPSGHRACSSMDDCEDLGTTPMGGDWADLYFSKLKDPYAKSPNELDISDDGIGFLKRQEGLYLQLYNDGNRPNDSSFYDVTGGGQGNCTTGYGHLVHTGPCNGDPREANFQNGITDEQANVMLRNDVVPAEKGVRKYVKVKLTQPQYDALVSLVFNWGIDNFRVSPKLAMLNNGDYVDMALHLREGPLGPNGQQYPGLVRRREAELVMFMTMVDRK